MTLAHPTTAARHAPRPRILRAEYLRTTHHTLIWLPLLGIPIALISSLMAHTVSGDALDLAAARWQGLYLTGLAAPILALYAATGESREKTNNYGATAWRPVRPTHIRLVRLAAVWTVVAAFHVVNFGTTALLTGGHLRLLQLGCYAFIGSVGIVGLAAASARRWGTVPTVLAAVTWQIGCGLMSDTSWWWAIPGAWPLRLTLPVMETSFNLVPLAPDHPLRHESPWLALALCILLALIGCTAAVATPTPFTGTRRRARTPHPTHQPQHATAPDTPLIPATAATASPARRGDQRARRLLAVQRAGFTPAVRWSILATLLVLAASARYPGGVDIATYLLFPLGAGVLPVLVWPALAPVWDLMRVASQRIRWAVITWYALIVTGIAAVAGFLLHQARWALLIGATSTVFMLISFLIVVRYGTIWALAVTVAAIVWSVSIGGDVLAATALWYAAPLSWPVTATTTPRFLLALASVVLGGVVVVLRAARTLNSERARTPR